MFFKKYFVFCGCGEGEGRNTCKMIASGLRVT